MELAEKRLIIDEECHIENGMNYNNIKRWTPNTLVQSKDISAYHRPLQTIIGITNRLGFSRSAWSTIAPGRE